MIAARLPVFKDALMSNPWMKFYPSDWRSDPCLRMCSIAARGLWMEMLCVMHENGGELSVNGRPLTLAQLSNLSGHNEVEELVDELEGAGVFSRRSNGTIFSRRMIRDLEKAAQDKENGRLGGNPRILKGVNPPVNVEDKAQKPEARSYIPEVEKEEPNGSSKKRGCRIPVDFVPDQEWAIANGMSQSQAISEAANFRDYWTAKAGAAATKLDWPATWRTWVRNSVQRAPVARGSPAVQKRMTVADAAAQLHREMKIAEQRPDPDSGTDRPLAIDFYAKREH